MLKPIANFIIKKRKVFIVMFFCLAILGAVLMTFVKVNYDMSEYLPDDSNSKESLIIMNKEFGENGTLTVMLQKRTLQEALVIKRKIADIENVQKVMWLDDAMLAVKDSFMPGLTDEVFINTVIALIQDSPNLIPEEMREQLGMFVNGNNSMMQVTFKDNAYALSTVKAIDEIKKIDGYVKLSGQAANAYSMQKSIKTEITLAMIIIVPLLLLILFLATTSYFDPIIFIMVMAISVMLNMGTNFFLGSISYLTNSIAALLQIAVSMDYSIMILHSYKDQRSQGLSPKESAVEALVKSFSPVSASSLTTIAGFCALMFMRFKLGFDIGLVLAKGILFSLITAFVFMPCFLVLTDKWITRGEHKNIMTYLNNKRLERFPRKNKNTDGLLNSEKRTIKGMLSKGVVKTRFIIPLVIIALVIPSFVAQGNNKFLYGDIASSGGEGSTLISDRKEIEKHFGTQNNRVILMNKSNAMKEYDLTVELLGLECVSSAQSYSFIMANAGGMDVSSMESQFVSENYTRIILFVNTDEESAEAFAAAEEIRAVVTGMLSDGYYIVGATVSAMELKTINKKDYDISTTVALLFILIILLISTRSIMLPIILAAVIQSAIWMNLAIPYLIGDPIVFLGYLIVSCFQMGCTIDYGILLSSNFTNYRKTMNKFDAAKKAFEASITQIALSASILMTVGFSVGIVASIPATAAIGIFLATGTLVSFILMTFVLPQLLIIFDKPILWTTLKLKWKKKNPNKSELLTDEESDAIENIDEKSELF